MTSVILGILIPFAIFALVLLCAIHRNRNIRAGIKIPFRQLFLRGNRPDRPPTG